MSIQRSGLKSTKAREGLLEVFSRQERPLEVSEAYTLLRKQGVVADQTTVYRSLSAFSEKGIVRSIHFNDGVVRYELADKPEHHHVVCIRCGEVEDIADCSVEKIERQITRKKGYAVVSHSLEFFGICPSCKKRT